MCALIDLGTATTLLGSKPTTLKIPDTSDDAVTHVDRCSWSAAESSLAYGSTATRTPPWLPRSSGVSPVTCPGGQSPRLPAERQGFVVAIGAKAMGRAIVPLTSGVVLNLTTTAATSAKAEALLNKSPTPLTRAVG